MLGDATGFLIDDITMTNIIKETGFAMINVTHHHHDGWSLDYRTLIVFSFFHRYR